jgi:hypothetical protein
MKKKFAEYIYDKNIDNINDEICDWVTCISKPLQKKKYQADE